jgi:hypothetical protein
MIAASYLLSAHRDEAPTMAQNEDSDGHFEYTGRKLVANVAIAAIAAGATAMGATGMIISAPVAGIVGAVITYLLTNEIPKIKDVRPRR